MAVAWISISRVYSGRDRGGIIIMSACLNKELIRLGLCMFCGMPVKWEDLDPESRTEWLRSGMCRVCYDKLIRKQ